MVHLLRDCLGFSAPCNCSCPYCHSWMERILWVFCQTQEILHSMKRNQTEHQSQNSNYCSYLWDTCFSKQKQREQLLSEYRAISSFLHFLPTSRRANLVVNVLLHNEPALISHGCCMALLVVDDEVSTNARVSALCGLWHLHRSLTWLLWSSLILIGLMNTQAQCNNLPSAFALEVHSYKMLVAWILHKSKSSPTLNRN